tara:strand:+ start:7452 stop:7757 length:306 start_codon:yes stop_codon:yes gene_type:complete
MKHLTLVVHANILQDVADILRSLEAIQGFTIAHVEGHGENVENNPFLSARDKVVGHTPRIRVDILLDEQDVKPVLHEIGSSFHGTGQGIYWVTAVEEKGRL